MWRSSLLCPICPATGKKVIYFGFPMLLCSDRDCNCLWGFWSWIPNLYFNGAFMTYEGHYLPALWFWLTGDFNDL